MLGDINILMTQRYPSVILAGGDRFVNNTTPSLSACISRPAPLYTHPHRCTEYTLIYRTCMNTLQKNYTL